MIHNEREMSDLVQEYGFMPFFMNEIPGFSIEEQTSKELWFSDVVDGPWEWKRPVARTGKCVYGKIFNKKAGFISLEWFPDFANYRRDGYDFDARFDDGLSSHKDNDIYTVIKGFGSVLSKDLKKHCDYRKGGNKGFDTIITRLQMQTYVIISDFEYMIDKHGKTYGWGVARYSTPEEQFCKELVTSAYKTKPQESKKKIYEYPSRLLPDANEKQILKILG